MKKILISSFLILSACSTPHSGPDKTVAGAVLGAAWGAGAGAVVGNQLDGQPQGEGAVVGAGFGLVSGAIQGAGFDAAEETLIAQKETLEVMEMQNQANYQQLAMIQTRLDNQPAAHAATNLVTVYFDSDATNLKSGSIAHLEKLAEGVMNSSRVTAIEVNGHADDAGSPDYNSRISEARARAVASYLAGRGLPLEMIKVNSFGSTQPMTSNGSSAGRQLNRRVEIYLKIN